MHDTILVEEVLVVIVVPADGVFVPYFSWDVSHVSMIVLRLWSSQYMRLRCVCCFTVVCSFSAAFKSRLPPVLKHDLFRHIVIIQWVADSLASLSSGKTI